jgi:hypothetical protein
MGLPGGGGGLYTANSLDALVQQFTPENSRCMKQADLALGRATKRASALIEALLEEMQNGVGDPELLKNPAWVQLFGDKQSMVVNLQKLVQALAVLPVLASKHAAPKKAHREVTRLNDEEMGILTDWLTQRETEA